MYRRLRRFFGYTYAPVCRLLYEMSKPAKRRFFLGFFRTFIFYFNLSYHVSMCHVMYQMIRRTRYQVPINQSINPRWMTDKIHPRDRSSMACRGAQHMAQGVHLCIYLSMSGTAHTPHGRTCAHSAEHTQPEPHHPRPTSSASHTKKKKKKMKMKKSVYYAGGDAIAPHQRLLRLVLLLCMRPLLALFFIPGTCCSRMDLEWTVKNREKKITE